MAAIRGVKPHTLIASRVMDADRESLTFCLTGDVMTGRAIDQILPCPGDPELRESYVKSAARYVELAEQTHGPIAAPVDFAYVWGDGLAVLDRLAPLATIVNLETSVTVSSEFWPDKEVHYRMHPRNVGCLSAARIDACVLANNHVLDFGRTGLAETLETLRSAGIMYAGAGANREEARLPARIAAGTSTLLLFAFGSTSSGIPQAWAAGAGSGVNLLPDVSVATADEISAYVRSVKRPGELAIASVHWGSNWGYEVSYEQMEFARRLVRGGVDIVHGHSSHHVRPIEIYEGRLILYGCGDLLSDYEGIRGYESWRGDLGAMYFVTVSARDGTLTGLKLAPLQVRRLSLRHPERADREWLRDTLNRISEPWGTRFECQDGGLLTCQIERPR